MVFNSKKGLSPLIAAVLLIVVVVGIGAVVTGIVREQVTHDKQTIERSSTDIQCTTEVRIEVPTYLDDFMICLGADYVNVTMENTGALEIDDFQLKVFGDAGFAENSSFNDSVLGIGQVFSNTMAYFDNSNVGNVIDIVIIPKKKVTGQSNKIFCSEASLKFSNIETC